MAGLHPPLVAQKLVLVFTGEQLARLEQACAGRTFAQRRDTAIIAVFKATGIRLSELAGIRYNPGDPQRSDVDLWQREITVRGKGGKDRIVRIGHQAARSLDRYIRARARHAQAWRPQLWLGMNNREPLTANGIYQMIARRGRQADVAVYPHRFRHQYCAVLIVRSPSRAGPGSAYEACVFSGSAFMAASECQFRNSCHKAVAATPATTATSTTRTPPPTELSTTASTTTAAAAITWVPLSNLTR
jgi:Phage integrase family